MMRSLLVLAGVLSIGVSSVSAQTKTATYVTFGTGCPGTGTPSSTAFPGVVVPKGHDQAWGDSNNYWGVGAANQRYQQVFLGSDIGKAMVMVSYQLRPDQVFPRARGGTQTYTMSLGYTMQSPATISGSFASNYDTSKGGPTQLFSGNINLPTWTSNTSPVFDDWTMTVPFTKPFIYAYVPGENLLFELANTSTGSVSDIKDAVSGPGANTTRIAANSGATQPTGNVYRNSGLVIKFNSPGSPGPAIPVLRAAGVPTLGQSIQLQLSRAKPSTAALLILGFSTTSWGPIPLPFDLTPLGAPQCSLLVAMDASGAFMTDTQGDASTSMPIPNMPGLAGVRFHNQWMVLDQTANGLGLVFSNGGTGQIY